MLLIIALVAPGCSWFKTKKEKSAQQLATQGLKYYDKGNYTKAIESFEKLKDWYPFSKYAILAELKLADSYFYRENYDDAVYAYQYFENLHPKNDAIPYVIFQIAMCHFKELSLPDRDQTATQAALDNFERLANEYPQSPEAAKALEHIKICQDHLARHEMAVGAFYFKSMKFEAARVRFTDILKKYPDVGVHKDALKYIALCNAYIAKDEAMAGEIKKKKEEKRRAEAKKARQKLEKERVKKEKSKTTDTLESDK